MELLPCHFSLEKSQWSYTGGGRGGNHTKLFQMKNPLLQQLRSTSELSLTRISLDSSKNQKVIQWKKKLKIKTTIKQQTVPVSNGYMGQEWLKTKWQEEAK